MKPSVPASGAQAGAGRALVEAWLEAIYRIRADAVGAGGSVRLVPGRPAPVPAPAPDRVHGLLTAFNPGGQPHDAAENLTRAARLRARLAELGLSWHPAANSAADGGWPEPSCWLPDVDASTLDALAGEFGQAATVCVGADGIARLRLYRDDWRAPLGDDPRWQWPQ